MIEHYAIICKETGKATFAQVAQGLHPKNCGHDDKTHRFVKLEREPTEHDTFNGKKLKHCADAKTNIEKTAKRNLTPYNELVERVEALEEALKKLLGKAT